MWQYFQSVAQIYSRSFKTKSLCQFFFIKPWTFCIKNNINVDCQKKTLAVVFELTADTLTTEKTNDYGNRFVLKC